MEELSDNIYELMTELVDEGKEFCEKDEYNLSTDKYKKAIRLLPNPKYEWEAFSWLTSSIGLNYLKLENWEDGFKFLHYSLLTTVETNDPLVWFSAGKALYKIVTVQKKAQ
jgi:tetratricopeptide (TPR) repeat protein